MPRPDETFIVRVRERDGDAVVEQPRLSRRRRIRDVADAGAVILRWLEPNPARPETDRGQQHDETHDAINTADGTSAR